MLGCVLGQIITFNFAALLRNVEIVHVHSLNGVGTVLSEQLLNPTELASRLWESQKLCQYPH